MISPEGTWIIASSNNNEARLWNWETSLDSDEPLRLPGGVFALDPKGEILATGPADDNLPSVLTWSLTDPDQIDKNPMSVTTGAGEVGISALSISPDGRWLATCDWTGQVRIKDLLDSTATLNVMQGGPDGNVSFCSKVEFSPDGHYLVAAKAAKR